MAGFEPGTLRLIQVNPLPIILTFTELILITWSWEGLVCGLNIVIGLTSCGLMTEFTSCGLIVATIRTLTDGYI